MIIHFYFLLLGSGIVFSQMAMDVKEKVKLPGISSVTRIDKLKITCSGKSISLMHRSAEQILQINNKLYPYSLKNEKRAVHWDSETKELYEKNGGKLGYRIKPLTEENAQLSKFCYLNMYYILNVYCNFYMLPLIPFHLAYKAVSGVANF